MGQYNYLLSAEGRNYYDDLYDFSTPMRAGSYCSGNGATLVNYNIVVDYDKLKEVYRNEIVAAIEEMSENVVSVDDVSSGQTDGTIKIKDTEVAVAGLESAAFTSALDYDPSGAAEEVYNAFIALTNEQIDAIIQLANEEE